MYVQTGMPLCVHLWHIVSVSVLGYVIKPACVSERGEKL